VQKVQVLTFCQSVAALGRKPKRLVEDKGILSIPTPQFGTILSDITVDNVK